VNKWQNNDWKAENNHLVYIPRDLTVIPEGERQEILKGVYENIVTGVGKGITAFYERIRAKYLNIRRKDVAEFLKSQKPYQLTRPKNHIVNKPILATALPCRHIPVEMGVNVGIKSSTVVDYYSRKVWLRRLKTQTAINVRNALINIVDETETYPALYKLITVENSRGRRPHGLKRIIYNILKRFRIAQNPTD
jgi:hypothetical protein